MLAVEGFRACVAVMAAMLFCTVQAQAQTSLPLAQPGRLSDYEDQLRRSGQLREGTPNGSSVLDNIQLDDSAKPKPENLAGAVTFVLRTLKVIGNSVLEEKLIAEQVRSFVGRSVPGQELQEMAARITKLYAERGYMTSRCIVPAQRVDDGNVVLQIEEDKLGSLLLGGLSSYRYDPRVFFDQVSDLRGKVINVPDLDERLRLVARIPGARVKPVLRKSAFGVTDLVLEISDIENLGTVSVSNDGSRLTSVNRLSVAKTFNNIAGAGDVLSLSVTTAAPATEYFGGLNASYQRPVGSNGGKLTLNYASLYYRLDPAAVGNNAIRYQGDSASQEVLYEEPVRWNAKLANLVWFGGLERKQVNASTVYNTVFDQPAGFKYVDSSDSIFAITAGLRGERYDDWWGYRGRSLGSLSVKRALPGWFGSLTPDSVTNKLENLAAASAANNTVNTATTAVTNAQTALSLLLPSDPGYATALISALRANAALAAAQLTANKYSAVTGPIGDVRGMQTDFTKYYLGVSRAQSLPGAMLLDASLLAEWTSAKRVPQAYDFAGADNGPSGYRVNLLFSRPVEGTDFVGGVGYTY
ncbi:MAG: POTRA domain-containing protein, partial [bacterium]